VIIAPSHLGKVMTVVPEYRGRRFAGRWCEILGALSLVMLFVGCGGGSGAAAVPPPSPPPPPPPPPAGIVGLDARPDNQTCVAPARPTDNASVTVIEAFPNLPFINQPTKMLLEPVGNPRWFVTRKTGQLVTFDPDNATALTTHIDLSGVVRTSSEGGLLGLAFHPNYPATPEIFLSYTINHTGPNMRSVISRFILDNVT